MGKEREIQKKIEEGRDGIFSQDQQDEEKR